jgi:hypothetical protein
LTSQNTRSFGDSGTWDFALIEDVDSVFFFDLDDDRKNVGGRLTIDSTIIQAAEAAFNEISTISTPFTKESAPSQPPATTPT